MALDKESTGVPEVDLERRTTKVNLTIIAAVGLFLAVGFGLFLYFQRNATPQDAATSEGHHGRFLVVVPLILALPALYWLVMRKAKGGDGGERPDSAERPELTGEEQAKLRERE
ncbi:MAG: hypothetical protein JWM32_2943 [Verrucomicrobia bacterium]|nr:hypothetical protein [Verrucomicrobiota bacterium]